MLCFTCHVVYYCGGSNYDQLWLTTSLRGIVAGTLRVDILTEGVHSGHASGVVPSAFRLLRQLLSRIEDPETGRVLVEECHVTVPENRIDEARRAAETLGDAVHTEYPFVPGSRPMGDDPTELLLNRSWRPTVSVTGSSGMPALADAGNVLLPFTSLRLSLRIPPTCDADAALARIRDVLETDPPSGARVRWDDAGTAPGWDAPVLEAWLESSLSRASNTYFGRDVMSIGQGGTIPFMAMLAEQFPSTQFVVTGVLGPGSNAHGPNEFLHIDMARKVTCCVAQILTDHHAR